MRLLNHDPLTGVSEFYSEDDEGRSVISYEQDVSKVLKQNKEFQKDEDYSKNGKKEEMWHVASIPAIVQLKWKMEEGIDIYNRDHWPAVRRKLMDSENRHLRTSLGAI